MLGAIAPTRKKLSERSPRPLISTLLPSGPGCLISKEQATHTKKFWCATARLVCWAALTGCPIEESVTGSTATRRVSYCATRLPSRNWRRSRSEGGRNNAGPRRVSRELSWPVLATWDTCSKKYDLDPLLWLYRTSCAQPLC